MTLRANPQAPAAASATGATPSGVTPMRVIGHATPRIDAVERVTGRAKYTGDVQLPGMLYAKVLRSPHPHARIKSIDTSAARALPGVKAVLTHENCQVVWGAGSIAGGQQYSDDVKKNTKQRRYAFNNPVRFVGEPIAAVAAVNRHVAEEALTLIAVDYDVLPFVLDQEDALKPDAPRVWPEGNLALNNRNEAAPQSQKRGDVAAAFAGSSHVFEDRYSTTFVHNAQMEPRAAVAHWEGDKLTLYTPTGGIANCRHDMARDLGIPDDKVRVVCQYMGGNFGNKNQNQDADLIAASLAKEAGAPVKLELSRRDDFVGMHGRWPTTQYYKVGVDADGGLTAIEQRGYSGMGGYRKNSGAQAGVELFKCANIETTIYPVYTNKTVSGNFRGPEFPQGFFGIQSMMDDVAYKMKMNPVEFALKNMSRMSRDTVPYTNYTLEECIHRGAESFDWKRRWKAEPGSDPGPVKRGAGFTYMVFRSGLGSSSAVVQLDAKGRYTLFVGVTDVGAGAKTTMGIIAADELGVPLSQVDVVWGDTDRCPVLGRRIGQPDDDHDRLRGDRSGPRLEEADRREGNANRRRDSGVVGDAAAADGQPRPQRIRRAFRRGRGGHRSRPRAHHEIHDGARLRPHHESAHRHESDSGRSHSGHRHGAPRKPALRRPDRPSAHARLLFRPHPDASRRATHRSHVRRIR